MHINLGSVGARMPQQLLDLRHGQCFSQLLGQPLFVYRPVFLAGGGVPGAVVRLPQDAQTLTEALELDGQQRPAFHVADDLALSGE